MVFLLVWMPDRRLVGVFYVIAALWGLCDAIWQTQCNCKYLQSLFLVFLCEEAVFLLGKASFIRPILTQLLEKKLIDFSFLARFGESILCRRA